MGQITAAVVNTVHDSDPLILFSFSAFSAASAVIRWSRKCTSHPELGARLEPVKHIFLTQDYPPHLGGMARRHVELCRRFGNDSVTHMEVSTVAAPESEAFDALENYPINRQPFRFADAKRFANQVRWGAWLSKRVRQGIDVAHCGNLRPVGYAVMLAHYRTGVPFLVYVYGGDLLKELRGTAASRRKAMTARAILRNAAGIVAISDWGAALAIELADSLGIDRVPPIRAIPLGTDPDFFHSGRDSGELRARWGVGEAPLLLTVARLVPHKGQDVMLECMPELLSEIPDLRYVIVGGGPDENRLRSITRRLGVENRVIFAGRLSDSEMAEAYATSTVYIGLSRVEGGIDAEGFGISFVEAAASGVPSVAGDSGGVRSAVRDGVTGILVDPSNLADIIAAIRTLLIDSSMRERMGYAARALVETHYNWDRVASETRDFTYEVARKRQSR
jgi:phosphatidylinositol alpha-1,6-mannosyltransferase